MNAGQQLARLNIKEFRKSHQLRIGDGSGLGLDFSNRVSTQIVSSKLSGSGKPLLGQPSVYSEFTYKITRYIPLDRPRLCHPSTRRVMHSKKLFPLLNNFRCIINSTPLQPIASIKTISNRMQRIGLASGSPLMHYAPDAAEAAFAILYPWPPARGRKFEENSRVIGYRVRVVPLRERPQPSSRTAFFMHSGP
jgi:hypothetical protein